MIAPLAFVIHTNAFLLLAAGFHHRPVGFNDRLIEERVRLLPPDLQSRLMEGFLQREDIELRKTSTEISRRRGVWNALSPERIEIRVVIAAQFQMLQTRPPASRLKAILST